ncbi:MAG: hypothetical protein A2Z91_05155 [Deltaproteobacteria bacterium GWA2_38_16]|nr:MAG: hypothetical protein A2Z91_05155 [Deltaproteobacteria bacterium GWA2_38_16]OGQ03167.1 MAG: hypothetical protein A3D19_03885 [Deltaproteobacteria bacterium RIFCSPHIGHO2_02_FULL_38_15]OGQ33762.1 MAG: hypothetical protein A3A72_06340 [Deltaproteobacteria bacterium RIFCSPLOWO2_01_FULL_38_9]
MISTLLFIALTAFLDPWSVTEKAPVMKEEGFWNQRFEYGFYFYQKVLSPADGARCGMYPTCADYGYQAIQKHGPLLGGWMATDRYMRDNGRGNSFYSLIEKFGHRRLFDPVSANDFWFTAP